MRKANKGYGFRSPCLFLPALSIPVKNFFDFLRSGYHHILQL